MTFISRFRTEIAISIIVTIICSYFIEPILGYASSILMFFLSKISNTYLDQIYFQVAQLETINYSFFLLVLYFGLLNGNIGILLLLITLRKLTHKLDTENPKEKSVNTNYLKWLSVLGVLMFLLNLSYIATQFTLQNLISTFQYHTRILAPYMSDQEEESLISRWSLMKTKNDYLAICKEMNDLAGNNNIELPSNRVYTIFSL